MVVWNEGGLEEAARWWMTRCFSADHVSDVVVGSVQDIAITSSWARDEVAKGEGFAGRLIELLSRQYADLSPAGLPFVLTMEPHWQFNAWSFNAHKRSWLTCITSSFAWAFVGDARVYETLTLVDGSSYEGEHRNGTPHGSGEQTWPDGKRFRGDFRNGLPHGFGTMAWPGGDLLESQWRNGRSRGRGVMTGPDGTSYCGDWLFGRQHGKWITTARDGRQMETRWLLGKRLSRRVLR